MGERKKTPTMSPENKAEFVGKEAMADLDPEHAAGCIDDRSILETLDYDSLPENIVRPDQDRGPQMLGGAYSPFDIALELAPDDYTLDDLDFDKLFDLTKKAFGDAGYVMGIHMGTMHGELSNEEVVERLKKTLAGEDVELPDCGYNGMVHGDKNPLELSQRSVEFHNKYPNRAAMFVKRGVSIAVLGGHHAKKDEALAVENTQKGKTLDTKKAIELGQPTYNHDQGPFREILDALANAVDEIDSEWGENIRQKGNEVYDRWLGVATNNLAGMDPIEV